MEVCNRGGYIIALGNFHSKGHTNEESEVTLLFCSAFEDRRFEPIWEEELPFLSCSVSLLFRFEQAESWLVRDLDDTGEMSGFRIGNWACTDW